MRGEGVLGGWVSVCIYMCVSVCVCVCVCKRGGCGGGAVYM
jgi:hypothetical protein